MVSLAEDLKLALDHVSFVKFSIPRPDRTRTAGEEMLILSGTMYQHRVHKRAHKEERSGEGLGHRGGAKRRPGPCRTRPSQL